jgi:hypothetical protein
MTCVQTRHDVSAITICGLLIGLTERKSCRPIEYPHAGPCHSFMEEEEEIRPRHNVTGSRSLSLSAAWISASAGQSQHRALTTLSPRAGRQLGRPGLEWETERMGTRKFWKELLRLLSSLYLTTKYKFHCLTTASLFPHAHAPWLPWLNNGTYNGSHFCMCTASTVIREWSVYHRFGTWPFMVPSWLVQVFAYTSEVWTSAILEWLKLRN